MADIQEIREAIGAFRVLDNRLGGGRIRPTVVEYLHTDIAPLLRQGRCTEEVRRHLFSAAAELTQLAGWQAYDLEMRGLAQRYLVQALTLARFAGDEARPTRPGMHSRPRGIRPVRQPGLRARRPTSAGCSPNSRPTITKNRSVGSGRMPRRPCQLCGSVQHADDGRCSQDLTAPDHVLCLRDGHPAHAGDVQPGMARLPGFIPPSVPLARE